jgi:hypothetical protein
VQVFGTSISISLVEEVGTSRKHMRSLISKGTKTNPISLVEDPHPSGTAHKKYMETKFLVEDRPHSSRLISGLSGLFFSL